MHSENISVRKVPFETKFIYFYNGNYYSIPSFGRCYILIDFGRSLIFPFGKKTTGFIRF